MEYLIEGIGVNGAYWLFSFENFLCLVFAVVFVKETKGLTDSQIKDLYRPKSTVAPEQK